MFRKKMRSARRATPAPVPAPAPTPPRSVERVATEGARVIERYNAFIGTGVYSRADNSRCRLVSVVHNVEIEDFASTIHTTQEFENTLENAAELVYKFALDPSCTPFSCTVHLINPETRVARILKAEIKEKVSAQEDYDDVIAEGGTAVLMEQESNHVLSLSLGNVKPKYLIRVLFSYHSELEMERSDLDDEGVIRFRLRLQAMHVSKDHGAVRASQGEEAIKNVSVNCSARVYNPSCSIIEMTSVSHSDEVTIRQENDKLWQLSTSVPVAPDADFEVQVKVTNYPVASWLVQKCSETQYAHMVSLLPQFGEDERDEVYSEMIIIVDRSGSMSGARMRYAKTAMKLFMQSLDADQKIKFNIVSFGSRCTSLFPAPVDLSRDNFDKAMRHIGGMGANYGGTNILAPVKKVLDANITANHSRQVFLLTDGEDSNTSDIVAYVKRHARSTRFFTFGIGSGINPHMLDLVAHSSHGQSVYLTSNDTIETGVMQQLERALQPCLSETQVNFPVSIDGKPVTDSPIPLVFNYQRSISYYFSTTFDPDSRLEVKTACGNTQKVHTLGAILIDDLVGRLAGRTRVKHLEKQKSVGGDEILKLGLDFQLVTSKTSFIMTAEPEGEEDDVQDSELVQVEIPTIQYRVSKPAPKPTPKPTPKAVNYQSFSRSGGRLLSADLSSGSRGRGAWKKKKDEKMSLKRRGARRRRRSRSSSDEEEEEERARVSAPRDQMRMLEDSSDSDSDDDECDGFGGEWSAVGTQKATRAFVGTHGEDWVAQGTKKATSEFAGTHGSDWTQSAAAPVAVAMPEPEPGPQVSFFDARQEREAAPKIASSNSAVSKVLLAADMLGLWSDTSVVSTFIGISVAEIEGANPGGADELPYWLTVLVVATLRLKHLSCKVQWNLLSRKSIKSVRKAGKADWISGATDFVQTH